MYLVSPEYVDKKPNSQSHSPTFETKLPQLKSALRRKRNNNGQKKNKKLQHPYDKWIKMRHKMEEADVGINEVISKLFPGTKKRGVECALSRQWISY